MKIKSAIMVTLAMLLLACGKQDDIPPPAATESKMTQAEEPVIEKMPVEETQATAEETGASMEQPVTVATQKNENVKAGETASGTEAAVLSRADALDLANKSGCLACHSVEKKVVGPAWQDVSARYKGDASVMARLIDKVKKGGKGNWTEVTGGIPMPPYSPRVADDTIEKLVTFVLSLPES